MSEPFGEKRARQLVKTIRAGGLDGSNRCAYAVGTETAVEGLLDLEWS